MLTQLVLRNFKRFPDATIPLGNAVVFVGPNNSGKTTALQALALWDFGLRRWNEKRAGEKTPEKRPGIILNRRELATLPVPATRLLWHETRTSSRQIEVSVTGVTSAQTWECGLEFGYVNEESFRVRPLKAPRVDGPDRMLIPPAAAEQRVVLLPPMAGLATVERRIEAGAIDVSLGEGRSAEVLRNLCHLLHRENPDRWGRVKETVLRSFGVELNDPTFVVSRGEIEMTYRERGVELDITSAGRGMHQMVLLLTHLYAHPRSVLLLDEPDAHLEILRQRETYAILTEAARESESQIIAATHSEVLLGEAAVRDVVIAFVGKPHRIADRGPQVLKSLRSIGFDQYLLAEIRGWILYLEGSLDLATLRAFAEVLGHPAIAALREPFVHYVANVPSAASNHFDALREARPDFVGIAIFDRIPNVEDTPELRQRCWRRNEIENYLCFPSVLTTYASSLADDVAGGPLFVEGMRARCVAAMDSAVRRRFPPGALEDASDPWWVSVKASDDLLDRIFAEFFSSLGIENLMRKSDYHELARLVPKELIDVEVVGMLDAIVEVAGRAKPVE